MNKNKKSIIQFIKFGMVGTVNTVLNIVIYWVAIHCGIHYLLANTIGFVVTVAFSYVLNNIYTFAEKKTKMEWSFQKLLKAYLAYFTTGMIINSILLWVWNDCVGVNENISPILNIFITVPLNFFINKFWVYRKNEGLEK